MKKRIKEKYKVNYRKFDKGGIGLFFIKSKPTYDGIKEILKNFGYRITDLLTEKNKGVEYYRVYSKKQKSYKYEIVFVLFCLILYIIKRSLNFSFF